MLKRFFLAVMMLASLGFPLIAASSLQSTTLQKEKIFSTVPPIANQDYFRIEFGFSSPKTITKLDYPFNAFAKAFIAEESKTTASNLRAGALGFGVGVLLPTQPWIPLSLELGGGFAKTALHEDPWFGVREKSVATKDQLYAEGGLCFRFGEKLLLKATYQVSTVKYFTKNIFFSVGANF